MKKITLREAYDLVEKSTAILLDGQHLAKFGIDPIVGIPENEWLFVYWTSESTLNGDGEPMYTRFIEEDQEILFDGTTLKMRDYEDESWELTLLVPMK